MDISLMQIRGKMYEKEKKRERGVVRVAPLGLNREQKMHKKYRKKGNVG